MKSNRRDFLYSGVSQFNRYVVQALAIVLVARFLPVGDFGVFVVGFTMATLLSLLVDYGFNFKLMVEIPSGLSKLDEVFAVDIVAKVFLFLVSIIIFFFVVTTLYNEHVVNFTILFISGVLFSFSNYIVSCLRVLNGYFFEAFSTSAYYFSLLFSLFLSDSLYDVCFSFFISRLVFLALSLSLLTRLTVLDFKLIGFFTAFRRIKENTSVFLIAGLASLYLYLDVFIIEHVLGDYWVGIYQVSFRIMMVSMLGPELLNAVVLPRASAAYGRGDESAMFSLINKSMLLMVMYSAFSSILIVFLSERAVYEFLGPEYSESANILFLLIPVLWLRSIGAPLGVVLLIYGRNWFRVFAFLVSIALGFFINILWLDEYGIIVAVVSSISVHFLLNLIYSISVFKGFLYACKK